VKIKFIIFSLLLFLGSEKALASEIDFSFQIKSEKELKVVNQNFSYPVELTPLVLKERSGNYLYILSTAWSWLCKSNRNILNSSTTNPVVTNKNDCKLISKPAYLNSLDDSGSINFNNSPLSQDTAWKQSYNGIMGANIIKNNLGEEYLVTFMHNENQNFRFSPGKPTYQNSFLNISANDCVSGMDASGVYTPCWDSFTSFVSAGSIKLSGGNLNLSDNLVELGPIAWPYNLMIKTDGKRSGASFYHANSFYDEEKGNLYAFSVNQLPTTSGSVCLAGFKTEASNWPSSTSFRNWFDKKYEANSLPSGFDKTNLQAWIGTRGNQLDCLFGNLTERNYWVIYTDVAKLAGTDYYMAVEEKIKDVFSSPKWTLSLKVSRDLIHWTDMKILNQTNSGWGSGSYSYPRFFNSDGVSAETIDANSFYILGTAADNNVGDGGYKLNAMNLSINAFCLEGADFDGDNVIGVNDLIGWYGAYRQNSQGLMADFDCSGKVDVGDLISWYVAYR